MKLANDQDETIYTLAFIISHSLMSMLLYSKTITDVLSLKIPYDFHISLPYITSFDIEVFTKEFKPHTHMYHIVIIIIIVITAYEVEPCIDILVLVLSLV